MNAEIIQDLETDVKIWQQSAWSALRELKAEQSKNKVLVKLIWAIVLKHGGETRLNESERGTFTDNWELLETEDMSTMEYVIKARSKT